jgi:hypothetical protein
MVASGASGRPARWILAFQRTTKSRLVRLLACGTYQHVMAFGYVAEVDHWIFFDWKASLVDIMVARGDHATQLTDQYTRDADLLGMEAKPSPGYGLRFGWWCVPAIRHLVGIGGGALRPDALWRDCIAQGADILSHDIRPASGATGQSARSDPAATAGARGQG